MIHNGEKSHGIIGVIDVTSVMVYALLCFNISNLNLFILKNVIIYSLFGDCFYEIMKDDGSGRVWVHNNKQGFVDCEPYALLEDWLSKKADDYLDNIIDKVHVVISYFFYSLTL